MPIAIHILIFSLVSCFSPSAVALAAAIRGSVVDERGEPIAGARVRVQATRPAALTDSRGKFVLEVPPAGDVVLTAWKEGYLNGAWGTASRNEDDEAVVVLKPLPSGDNPDYQWLSADSPTLLENLDILWRKGLVAITAHEGFASRFARNCSNCHGDSTVPQWRADAHSRAARNPILLSMYNGTDAEGRSGVFPGYRLDFPNSEGNCANCHSPLLALTSTTRDLNRVSGIAREGISCDFCHKVRDVVLRAEGGFPGVLSIELNRPHEGQQVFFGPYDDAVAGPDTFGAVYAESRFCAACHRATFWDVPIYSEFDEWSKSAYARDGIHCQDCHMPSNGTATHVARADKGAVRRDPEAISTHTFRGVEDARFMSEAIALELNGRWIGDVVRVAVDLTNVGAGHHFPTGVPMRNVILLLDAIDADGKRLKQVDGPVVPAWGGSGRAKRGNYAGRPGKGYAKVLADAAKSFPLANPDHQSPTPHWRHATIFSDNRIPAKDTDASRYRFRVTPEAAEPITVAARVIYRRAFKSWVDAKKWPLNDLEIASKTISISPQYDVGGRVHVEGSDCVVSDLCGWR